MELGETVIDREHIRQRHQRWRDQNSSRLRQKKRKYYRNNPKKQHLHNQVYRNNQRARKMGAKGKVTYHQWKAIKAHYNNTCLMCGEPESLNGSLLTMDHIVPLSKGGKHQPDNLQPLCLGCNSKKWASVADLRPDGNVVNFGSQQLALFDEKDNT